MKQQTDAKSSSRRDFFRKAGVGAGALGATAVTLVAGQGEAAEPVRSPSGAGYRETDHVKKYYELAKF